MGTETRDHPPSPRQAPIALRGYQHDAIKAVRAAFKQGTTRQVVALATGLGKTIVAAEAIRRAMSHGFRVLFLAHRDELLQQVGEKILLVYPDAEIGLVKAEADAVDAPIVIGSMQTLCRKHRLARLTPEFRLLVVDECHHATEDGTSYWDVLHYLGAFRKDGKGPLVLGLTATPERRDGSGLGNIFQQIVYRKDILQGIREGHLSNLRAVQVCLDADLQQLHTRGGDFLPGEATDLLQAAHAPEVAVKAWFEHANGRKTIVFTPTVALAYAMPAAFQPAGVTAEAVDGNTNTDERRAILKRFQDGRTLVLCNCAVLTEGFDAPDVSCVVIARPTKSHSLYVQMIGRGTRKHPGKTDCLFIDLVGATLRHDLQACATLFNIPPHTLARKGVAEATRDRERARQGQPTPHVLPPTHARTVDLYRQTPMRWLTHAGAYLLNLAEHGYLELAPHDGGRWT